MENTFDIYFDDLSVDTKIKLLELVGSDNIDKDKPLTSLELENFSK